MVAVVVVLVLGCIVALAVVVDHVIGATSGRVRVRRRMRHIDAAADEAIEDMARYVAAHRVRRSGPGGPFSSANSGGYSGRWL